MGKGALGNPVPQGGTPSSLATWGWAAIPHPQAVPVIMEDRKGLGFADITELPLIGMTSYGSRVLGLKPLQPKPLRVR